MIRYFTLLLSLLCLAPSVLAQVSLGLRQSYYAFAQYRFLEHYAVRVEQSLYSSEKPQRQYVRLYASYRHQGKDYALMLSPYWGTTYNHDFTSFGAMCQGLYQPLHSLQFDVTLNPHYDANLHYFTCVRAGVYWHVTDELAPCIHFDNIPVFRMRENRLNLGSQFAVGGLRVLPELSLLLGDNKGKYLRVMVNFQYTFKT